MATTLFVDAVTLSSASWFNDVDSGIYALTAVAGTNTITATGPNSLTAYATGKIAKFIPAATNTGATTINISSLGAKNVFYSGAACVGGELKINVPVQIYYDGTQFNILGANTIYTPSSTTSEDLVSYEHVDLTTAHRDTIKAGFLPAWFNQQWGGGVNYYELVDAATGTPYKFESATGYVEQTDATDAGAIAGRTGISQGFKVSASQSITGIWIKLYKILNPTNNLELRIQADDGTGKPTANFTAITNGTATAIGGKLFQSGDTAGQWVRFNFATPCALTAGTQYHFTLKSSGAVDAANYWLVERNAAKKYPHGNYCAGDATPTWTATTTAALLFLVEAPTTTATFQSGGIFGDGKAVFYEGSPLNQSNQRTANLADLKGLTPNNMTLLLRGTAHTKDKTIADMTYGLDHDRVVLRCAVTTGYPTLTIYDSAGTASTVTGTTDISSGDHDVAALVTSAGCSLWVDGVSQGTPIVTTITFDTLFAQGQIGTLWIGGGFALAPTWSGSSISSFTGLPSTLGWTWTGVATEANAMSVSGGKLYQNKSGYTALQDGYYKKTTAGLSNANGWNLTTKERTVSATNTKDILGVWVGLIDGSKAANWLPAEYYLGYSSTTFSPYAQLDLKTNDNVLHNIGKASDCYSFVNGKLIVDGTGKLDSASATNEIYFGDGSTTSGESSDVVWSYMKYYTTAALLPQATSGSLSEWAIWTGDKTSILATLWNSGSPISVKQFCGLGVNWKRGDDGAWVHSLFQRNITANPTTTSSPYVQHPEMEGFVIGSGLSMNHEGVLGNASVTSQSYTITNLDGADLNESFRRTDGTNTNQLYSQSYTGKRVSYFGLHKTAGKYKADGVTTVTSYYRNLTVEARS